MLTRTFLWALFGVAVLSAISGVSRAGAASPPPIYVDSKGIAISGYDVVSYFQGEQPAKGRPEWYAEFRGAKFHFASKAHRDEFLAEPERFVPQFGGYCAFAMGKGKVLKCDPRRFSLKDGKLYLFSGSPAKKGWDNDSDSLIAHAVAFWQQLFPN